MWYDHETKAIRRMLLERLPQARGGPRSVTLDLVDEQDLGAGFFGHESHHEPGRVIEFEEHSAMKRRTWMLGILLVMGVTTVNAQPPLGGADSRQAAGKPNFVFILGEGQGWVSTSVPMDDRREDSKSDFLWTPSFERLAREGMRFSTFYAPSPRCTPSRAAYFTGISPAQLHMTFVSQRGALVQSGNVTEPRPLLEMPLTATTIAELLKPAGYATAHFGKWHVGRTPPSQHGFDESDGATNNGGPENVDSPNPKQAYGITERGIDFMTRHVKTGKPFYLQVSQPDQETASRKNGDVSYSYRIPSY